MGWSCIFRMQSWLLIIFISGSFAHDGVTSDDGVGLIIDQLDTHLHFNIPTASAVGIDERCIQSSRDFIAALRNHSKWALQSISK